MPPDDIESRLRAALTREPLSPDPSVEESRAHLQALHDRMRAEGDLPPLGVPHGAPVRRPTPVHVPRVLAGRVGRSWTPVAVAVAGLATIALVATQLVPGRLGLESRVTNIESYATRAGERATVRLADGSRVTLAPASKIRVEHRRGTRVTLDGEAYFDVAHRPGTPFEITTGRVTTRVLGTSFDVRHYAGDPGVRVAVVTGKVSVGAAASDAPSLTVTAGTIATMSDSTSSTTVGDVSNYTRWASGTMAFKQMPASEVLNTLGHWYGYEFKLQDTTLASQLLTLHLEGESDAAMLRSLRAILDVTMTFDGHVVTLVPRRAQAAPASRRERYAPRFQSHTTEVGR